MDENDAEAQKSTRRRRVEGGRHLRHVVRVTPAEDERLLELAGRFHVTVPKLLVDSALAGGADAAAANASVRGEVLTSLFTAQRLLAGIANNVNQLSKVANSTGVVPAELPATLAAAIRTTDHIDQLVDEIIEAIQ